MNTKSLNIVIVGLSITSSWGNGHATTFRAITKELNKLGHDVTFLENDVPWYAAHRDMPDPDFCHVFLYQDQKDLRNRYQETIQSADLVIVGSFVNDGVAVGEWVCSIAKGVKAFYDIDTPVTLRKLKNKDFEYISTSLIPRYDLYLSFSGGPILSLLENKYGAQCAKMLCCSVDPELYFPEETPESWDLGYLGTYSDDRQPPLEKLFLEAARNWPGGKFVVAGPQYPERIAWPDNVSRINHLPPDRHRKFYNAQKFTLNITRADMIKAGYSPSVRLFEAAACGTPVISDYWEGLESFFEAGSEIFISESAEDTLSFLQDTHESERSKMGENARAKILKFHTSKQRAEELLTYTFELMNVNPVAV